MAKSQIRPHARTLGAKAATLVDGSPGIGGMPPLLTAGLVLGSVALLAHYAAAPTINPATVTNAPADTGAMGTTALIVGIVTVGAIVYFLAPHAPKPHTAAEPAAKPLTKHAAGRRAAPRGAAKARPVAAVDDATAALGLA